MVILDGNKINPLCVEAWNWDGGVCVCVWGGRGGVVGEFIPHDYCYFNKAITVGKAVLVGSRYIGDYYFILELQYMYYIPLPTLLSGLFINIKHVKFTGPETRRA